MPTIKVLCEVHTVCIRNGIVFRCVNFISHLFQEMFESGVSMFEQEGIKTLGASREQLELASHPQARLIRDRHANVMRK